MSHNRQVRWILVAAFCLLGALPGGRVEAQSLFPRFAFHLDGQYVTSSDPRFNWIFDFGGEVDVVRAGGATATFVANYEALAGEQFRRFDVNQGNYLLEGVLLFRAGPLEVGPVWHHVSRHLSDRPKRFPIDWNMIAFRVRDRQERGSFASAWRADVRKTVTHAFVDYDWELDAAADLSYRVAPRVAWTGGAVFRLVGVDGSRERGSQAEGKLETGLRIDGAAAAAEVFVGIERRLDPYATEFGTGRWFLAGIRLSSR